MTPKIITEEKLHEIIHENLVLLDICGHKIDFKQGMFQKNNIVGFENVGYAVLMLIDPKECKHSIPWPLIDDKSLRSEFRTKFIIFIKMINKKYPEARIPELTSSMLHFPGGMKFLRFMHKLTSLAVELQLKTVLGQSDEFKNLLPKYKHSLKPRDNCAKVHILKGGRLEVLSQTTKHKQLISDTNSQLTQLHEFEGRISEALESVQFKIETELSHLHLKSDVLKNLSDVSIDDEIKAWNTTTQTKVKQLNQMGSVMKRLQSLSVYLCGQLREMMTDPSSGNLTQSFVQSPCLDGNKLTTSDQLAGRELKTNRNTVKLESLIRGGREEAKRLCCNKTGHSISLLPQALSLLELVRVVQISTEEKTTWMDKIGTECDECSCKIRPVMYMGCDEQFIEEDKLSEMFHSNSSEPSNKEWAQETRKKVMSKIEEHLIANKPRSRKLRRSGSIESFVTPNISNDRKLPESPSFSKPKSHMFTPFYSAKKKTAENCSNGMSASKRSERKPKLRRSVSLQSLKDEVLEFNLASRETSPENSGTSSSLLKGTKSQDSPSYYFKYGCSKIPVRSRPCQPVFSQQESNPFETDKRFSEQDQHSAEEESDSSEMDSNKIETKRKSLDLIVARFLKIKESMNKHSINKLNE